MSFNPYENLVGGFSPNDGTIDFYLRINSLLRDDWTVLDLGAGRAAWYEDDECSTRRNLRLLKGKVKKVIAADVDEAVLDNNASDEQLVIKDNDIGIEKHSVDLIVCDYVLEYISEPKRIVEQIDHVLKDGGWFCARTPHKYSYVALVARLVKNSSHSNWLKRIQPDRKEQDVFPTVYQLNTMRDIMRYFAGWRNHSFLFRADPSYFFGSQAIYHLQAFLHRVMFAEFNGNLFVFMQKRSGVGMDSGDETST